MNWLIKALSSTIGKKFVMGITGLLLCGFLVAHLAGNLLMYVGADAYNNYAHTLHSQEWFVKIMEVGLLLLFLAHLTLAIRTGRENIAARSRAYEVKTSKKEEQGWLPIPAETWMFISGAVVLVFLVVHLSDFALELRLDINYEELEPFDKAMALLTTPVTMTVYTIGCLILGAHLTHGFASAFQSLGLSHPKYTPWIKCFGAVFAVVIALGFISFVVFANLPG